MGWLRVRVMVVRSKRLFVYRYLGYGLGTMSVKNSPYLAAHDSLDAAKNNSE